MKMIATVVGVGVIALAVYVLKLNTKIGILDAQNTVKECKLNRKIAENEKLTKRNKNLEIEMEQLQRTNKKLAGLEGGK